MLSVIISTPDYLHDALLSYSPLSPVLPNSPGSALARWLHFAKHSCLACECKTVQLQRNVFFGLSPLAVPLWQEGRAWKVEERGVRGNVLFYCLLLRHQEGKDEITPATLPLAHCKPLCKTPTPVLAEPQSYTEMQAEEEKSFSCLLPCFFILKSTPEGSCGPCTFLNSHTACLTRVGSCENPTPGERQLHPSAGSKPTAQSPLPSARLLGGLMSSASPSLFPSVLQAVGDTGRTL